MRGDTAVPVVILEFHHGSMGIARSLGRLGVEVHAVDTGLASPALRSRYISHIHRIDVLGLPPNQALDQLLAVGKGIGGRPVLIPTSDETAVFVAQHAASLGDHFRFPIMPASLVETLTSKKATYDLAKAAGVPVPVTRFPASLDDVRCMAGDIVYPVMLKGINGKRLYDKTGNKMVVIQSPDELLQYFEAWDDDGDPNLMIQEYIPGGDDTIWIFNGYFDDASKCLGGFTGRKIRQTPIHVGATSLGICEANAFVAKLTCDFMAHIGYRGILDIGFRYDARDGQYKLLDPNPRIGSTFRLFLSDDGTDVARMLYWHLTDQPIPDIRQREGRKWFIEDRDFESCLHYRREGSLTLGQWLGSYRGVQEAAWFAWDDPLPSVHVTFGMMKRFAEWIGKRMLGKGRLSTTVANSSHDGRNLE